MKLMKRIKQQSFPLWVVAAAEPDFFEPTKYIRVKVKKPLGEDSHIKIKGNCINSEWGRMEMPYYYVGSKKLVVREVSKDICALLIKLKARVRVPKLEAQHERDIYQQQKVKYSEAKRRL
jgi:hypothetical protein